MATLSLNNERRQTSVTSLGFWTALVLAILAALAFALGITTPPR